MSEPFPTIGGQVTRGETFTKLVHHLREAQNLCCVMAHLIQLQDSSNPIEGLLAKGWLGINELIEKMIHKITQLAQKRLQ